MELKMIIGKEEHLSACKEALRNSELGKVYFSSEERLTLAITEGITKNEIHVAMNDDFECIGFLWIIPKGAFHSFPYLHIIAVKEEYRNLGIGKKLLQYFEDTYAENATKLFLVVGDFNKKAKKLYQSIGYQEVGDIPNLYKNGVAETLMMKVL